MPKHTSLDVDILHNHNMKPFDQNSICKLVGGETPLGLKNMLCFFVCFKLKNELKVKHIQK